MPALIELKGVNKKYQLGHEVLHVLQDVNLEVGPGEFVAIIGPSGSGKSTLANIVGGLDQPNSGRVLIDGLDLSRAGDKKLSSYRNEYIGFVFQAFNLQSTHTALENVMVPMLLSGVSSKERKERAKAALRAVGLGDRMVHKPTELSGGQRQRVSIARALVNKPRIIIADEPTGNLDSHRGKETLELLKHLNSQGITVIVITHDMEIARQAGRVLSIHDGVLSEARAS